MRAVFAFLSLAASVARAHYTFPSLIVGGQATGDWVNVRKTENYQSNGPVQDVTSEAIRCYQLSGGSEGVTTADVKAGDEIGFTASPNTYHPGPLAFYMAKVPESESIDSWDGSGAVWFKIYEDGPTSFQGNGLTWKSDSLARVFTTIPSCIPDGDYLLRVEHIGLHSAASVNGAQFYISCAQIHISGGGSTMPTDLIELPGAYDPQDPGILINIYYPTPTSYTNIGPAVFSC